MQTQSDWQAALTDVASEVRTRSQVHSPPVDAILTARALGLAIAVDQAQIGRGRVKRIQGRPSVFVRPEPRPERLQWTLAHEIGECQVEQICRAVGVRGEDLSPRQREDLANQFAQELLLPLDWFRRDCAALEFSLPALKARYRTASHELIAWRWLDLELPGIVTIYDQGSLTRRRGNGHRAAPAPLACEQSCWRELRRTRQAGVSTDQSALVRGWCIDTPDWQREILYLQFTADDPEFSD